MNVSPHWQPSTDADKNARIQSLAERFESDEIASMLNIAPAAVRAAISTTTRAKWWVRNKKTGRHFTTYGQSEAYLRVCIFGWTDWDWGIGEVGKGVQP